MDVFALRPVTLSENMVVFFHLFKDIKEKYIKLFPPQFHLYSFKYIIQNHPTIERNTTVSLSNLVIKSSIEIFKNKYLFLSLQIEVLKT